MSYKLNTKDLVVSQNQSDFAILNTKTGDFYSLNPTAGAIWEKISANNSSETDLINALQAEFEVTREIATAAVKDFILSLKKENLIL